MHASEALEIARIAHSKDERPNLSRANLVGADLSGANLSGAYLSGAYLVGANLSGADLRGAYLRGATLSGADLSGTCLDPINTLPPLTDEEITAAGLIVDGDLVRGWRTSVSQVCGNTSYEPGSHHVAPWFSTDSETPCHPGIYLASQEYLASNHEGVLIVPCHCLRSELVHAGDKFRTKQLWIEVKK
jgi:hypothetical protein